MALLNDVFRQVKMLGADIKDSGVRDAFAVYFMALRAKSPTLTTIITSDGTRLQFDVAKSVQHDLRAKVTSFPVEDKSNVSDHRVKENPRFSVRGIFSDAAEGVIFTTERYSQSEFYRELLKMWESNELVTLITPLDTYSNLSVVGLSTPKDAGNGRALFVDIEFEKIRKVSSELTTVFVKSKKPTGTPKAATAKAEKKPDLAEKTDVGEVPTPKSGSLYGTEDSGVIISTVEAAAGAR